VIAAVVALAALSAALAGALLVRGGFRLRRPRPGARRILVPFTGGTLESTVLDAAIRIAQAEEATLVPAYLLLVPLRYAEDSPLADEVRVAMPWLEAVEHAAHRAGVPVDARIEKGRTPTHALQRLWAVEGFDRVIAPAPVSNGGGFSPKDLTWILAHAPAETLVLRPTPPTEPGQRAGGGTVPAPMAGASRNGRQGSRDRCLQPAARSAQHR
jgi:nucleotide-binding universal stress UspA family protein